MRKRNLSILAVSCILLVLCASCGFAYGFLQGYFHSYFDSYFDTHEGTLLVGVADSFKPSNEQVLAGQEALGRWNTTVKEERVPLAQSIVMSKALLKMPKTSVIKALGEPKADACEDECHMHYVMIETDQQDIDLVVEFNNGKVNRASVRKWLW